MTTRKYSSRAQQTTLSSGITSGDLSMTVGSGANLMGGKTPAVGETYTVVIDPDTALEEIVDVSNYSSGNTLTITRGIDGSTGVAHSAGAIVRHMVIGRDLTEANTHVNGTLAQHTATTSAELRGVISDETGTGSLVFATSPTIATPTITSPTITGLTLNDASIIFEGATADAFETTLTVQDPTADRTITFPNVTGTVTILDATQTLSNKTLGSDLAAGSFKITGLADPTSAQDAVTKTYADSIITTAAASATAAASSATAAASSASAASTSASNASTSASAASGSASTATTQATNAASSATTATTQATSATSSATSATSSATSATSSATTATSSATTATTQATNAANSATAAAASETAAAASATSLSDSSIQISFQVFG
jgi:hypothetical protein